MEKSGRTSSLRLQMSAIILLCWLLPMLMVFGIMGWYLSFDVNRQEEASMARQFQLHLSMSAERVDSAVEASRLPSYDPTFQEAWAQYRLDGNYAILYRKTHALFSRLYQSDSRFRYAVFSFSEDPEARSVTVFNGSSGMLFGQVKDHWQEDSAQVRALAEGLDTSVGFLEQDGRIYLVRNLLDSSYQPIGVLALALDPPYYFQDLAALPWASAVAVLIQPDTGLWIKGEEDSLPGQNTLEADVRGKDCRIYGVAAVDQGRMMAGFAVYWYLLAVMALSLLLLLILTFRFLRRNVTRPVEVLMEGAAQIEDGQLGCQIDCQTGSRELQYLTHSFNRMSSQLQTQFKLLYQEELARKDAQIKALQAHINPHFLNNTLEIINWQARMSRDEKASKMIEALSTVLDAALDRRGSPEVRLAEEMTYVNAYLYIVGERFGERLTVDVDLPEDLMDCMVPRLILQPVIENAVEHGIGPSGRGRIVLRGRRQGRFLILESENDGGLTMEDEAHIRRLLSQDPDLEGESSRNIGIANVNLRLRILYGSECGLSILPGEGTLVTARLTLLFRKGTQANDLRRGTS